MLKLPNVRDRLHWTEGMLLSPQHFQHSDHFLESLVAHNLASTRRHFWGVNELQIDNVALSTNLLRVTALEAVFPDGSVIQFKAIEEAEPSGVNEEPISIALDDLDVEPGEKFTIAVSLAKYNLNCASDVDSDRRRFVSVNEGVVPNISDPDNQVDLVTLRPLLRLAVDRAVSPNHTSLPIIKLEKTLDGSFQRLPFTPPLLSASIGYNEKADDIWEKVSQLTASARSHANQLRSQIAEQRSDQVMLERQRALIISLTHQVPAIEILLDSQCHPFDVYRRLIDWTSDLATIQNDPVPPKFPAYVHNDIYSSLKPVLDYVESTIRSVRLDYEILQFTLNDNDHFICSVSNMTSSGKGYVAFQVPQNVDKDTAAKWVESAYICGESDYENLSLQRDIGLKRNRIQRIESFGLIEGNNEILYEIDLPNQTLESLLITGSDKALDFAAPKIILYFMGREV